MTSTPAAAPPGEDPTPTGGPVPKGDPVPTEDPTPTGGPVPTEHPTPTVAPPPGAHLAPGTAPARGTTPSPGATPAPDPRPIVTYQGEPGAFSEEALRLHFGEAAVPLPSPTFRDALGAVVRGEARFAVIPVENSGAGPVTEAHQALEEAGLLETARVVLPLRQMLLAPPGATFEALREVRSHPVALAQCRRFLEAHPHLRSVAVADTAGAAREVAAVGDRTRGALASLRAAEAHGLQVVRPDVHDDPENRTTFVVVRAR